MDGMFENDVKTYGTQAMMFYVYLDALFENDVKTYGTQAYTVVLYIAYCLRMM